MCVSNSGLPWRGPASLRGQCLGGSLRCEGTLSPSLLLWPGAKGGGGWRCLAGRPELGQCSWELQLVQGGGGGRRASGSQRGVSERRRAGRGGVSPRTCGGGTASRRLIAWRPIPPRSPASPSPSSPAPAAGRPPQPPPASHRAPALPCPPGPGRAERWAGVAFSRRGS